MNTFTRGKLPEEALNIGDPLSRLMTKAIPILKKAGLKEVGHTKWELSKWKSPDKKLWFRVYKSGPAIIANVGNIDIEIMGKRQAIRSDKEFDMSIFDYLFIKGD